MEKCHDRSSTGDNSNSNAAAIKGKEMWTMSCCKQYGREGPALGCSAGAGGFSWLQRSYSCSFCKREFRSAQALGGHMNVHRRDKARLRASPPPDLGPSPFNSNPNPNLCTPPPPTTTTNTPCSSSFYPLPNLNLPPPPSNAAMLLEDRRAAAAVISEHLESPAIFLPTSVGEDLKAAERGKFSPADISRECMELDKEEMPEESAVKGGKLVNLNLEIGFFGDHGDGLDLELRLGYTN